VTRSNVEWSENPQIQDAQYPNRDRFLHAFRFGQHALKLRPLSMAQDGVGVPGWLRARFQKKKLNSPS